MPDETVSRVPAQAEPPAGGADLAVTDCPRGSVLVGRYQVQQQIGAGGMGAVYRAVDTTLNRDVAVKVLPPRALPDPAAVNRFRREAQALARLSDPHIVQAYDAGEDRGRHFLVMEYVEGVTLAQLLKDRGRVPPGQAAAYARQVALALHHAHERGIVHRDVKPSNILLARDGRVKLADLGLARLLQDQIGDPGLTTEGAGMGTPDYMAPEQFGDAHTSDARADVYGLGCTLYHLLTGRVAFPRSSLSEKRRAHQDDEPAPLEQGCPQVPPGLAQVVRRAMAKRPEDRFQTAREAAEALAPYAAETAPAANAAQATVPWQDDRFPSGRGRKATRRLVIGAVAAALSLALFFAWARFGRRDGPPANLDPNVLTVAQDGAGQFRTIGEALKQAKPGQTIRVLDSGTYEESVLITDPDQHHGVTLEAVQKATIRPPPAAYVGLLVKGVPHVTVRGFRLELGEGQTQFAGGILGKCPGVVFDDLHFTSSRPFQTCAVSVKNVEHSEREPPVIVQNCTVHGFQYGFRVEGEGLEQKFCRSVAVRQNNVSRCGNGIWISGWINDLHIVGNRVTDCGDAAIELASITGASSGILVANNSVQNSRPCLQIRDPMRGVRGVEIRNNLLLAKEGLDVVFLGKDRLALKEWRLDHNWRQVRAPKPGTTAFDQWVGSPDDTLQDQIELTLDSSLAGSGAGGDLPGYVGAVPPEGIEPWDWDKTWKAKVK